MLLLLMMLFSCLLLLLFDVAVDGVVVVVVVVAVIVEHYFPQDADTFHNVLPDKRDAETWNQVLAHQVTPSDALMDVLTTLDKANDSRLVLILCSLERCQMAAIAIQTLSSEEDQVAAVDAASLIRMSIEQAKLGPLLNELKAHIKFFTDTVAAVADLLLLEEAPFDKYKFAQMTPTLDAFHTRFLDRAIARWHKGLKQIIGKLKEAMPDGWRARSIDTADEEWIKANLLCHSLIAALGTDYTHGRKWLESVRKFDTLTLRYNEKHSGELEDADGTFDDAQTIVGLILIYNCMFVKFPKTKGKQALYACAIVCFTISFEIANCDCMLEFECVREHIKGEEADDARHHQKA